MASDTTDDIDRHAIAITERLLDHIASDEGGFGRTGLRAADVAAHQLLWTRYIVTGTPRFGEAVLHSLRALCRSAFVDTADGGARRFDEQRGSQLGKDLCDNARLLELLTWVWRVERCPELRTCAEGIAGWAVAELRVPGLGFAENTGEGRGRVVRADANGLMLVALVEAGSVFERRDWLALARDVFDEVVFTLADAAGRGRARRPNDDAMMSRAAIRLFEAFGKQRYLDLAETWAAAADAVVHCGARDMTDRDASPGDAVMIGILARLHALTGVARYAEQAEKLVVTLQPAIARSGIAGVAAFANVQTAAQLVSIQVSGDPRLTETRELMRIALDCGLPDRLVLGPGAGGLRGEHPLAQVCVGTRRLAAIDDAARLRTMLAPGGLDAAFIRLEARETVDSRRARSLT